MGGWTGLLRVQSVTWAAIVGCPCGKVLVVAPFRPVDAGFDPAWQPHPVD